MKHTTLFDLFEAFEPSAICRLAEMDDAVRQQLAALQDALAEADAEYYATALAALPDTAVAWQEV